MADAYLRFHRALRIRNKPSQGYGREYCKPMCIPKGCPFSMVLLSLALRVWILQMRSVDAIPRSMADDAWVLFFDFHKDTLVPRVVTAFDLTFFIRPGSWLQHLRVEDLCPCVFHCAAEEAGRQIIPWWLSLAASGHS